MSKIKDERASIDCSCGYPFTATRGAIFHGTICRSGNSFGHLPCDRIRRAPSTSRLLTIVRACSGTTTTSVSSTDLAFVVGDHLEAPGSPPARALRSDRPSPRARSLAKRTPLTSRTSDDTWLW